MQKKGKLSLSVKRLREKDICITVKHIHAAIAALISWGLLENSNHVFRHIILRDRVTREYHTSEDVRVARALARDEIESFLVGEWYIVLNRSSDASVENSVLKCIQKDLSFHGT